MAERGNPYNVSDSARADRADAKAGCASSASALPSNLEIEYVCPEQLRPFAANARKHSKKQLKQIAKSIEQFGFVNPVLISDDFEIIAGHGRVEVAKRLGLTKVPAVRLSRLSPAERRAYVIADNRLAELADWDRDLLASELQGLLDLQFDDIELTGFSLDDIDVLLDEPADKKTEELEDERPASRLQGPVVSRAGDVWMLGPHRLLCGDGALDCDLIIRRWQRYTGKAARLEGAGLTFAEVAAARLAEQKNASGADSQRGG